MRWLAPVVVLTLALGCGRSTYTATGDVTAVDPAALRVTISHDDIPGLMGAMTMAFPVRSADVLAGIAPGTRVRFELVRAGHDLIVTRLVALGTAAAGRPGIHDHTPHHGGVVAMVGMRHLEAVAARDGSVRVYLTDVWRRPLPLAGATGTVTVDLPEGRREIPLAAHDGALEGSGPPLAGDAVAAHVRVVQAGKLLESHFVVPLGTGMTGAAGIPPEGCVPPDRRPDDGQRLPRCVLAFPRTVTFIAASPDGSTAFVGVLGTGVSAWRMPGVQFLEGFAPPPPIAVPVTEVPHPEAANAIAVSPDGAEAAVAVENRVLVYVTAGGRLLRELPAYPGVVRALAWSPAAARLLVTVFYDPSGHLLAAGDGREVRRLVVEREGAAVAFSPDGRRAAVASDAGPIAIFDLDSEVAPRLFTDSERAVEALAFAGDRLLSASADGIIRVWDAASGTVLARHQFPTSLHRAAMAPRGELAAVGGLDRKIRLIDLASGALVEELAWHRAPVWGLAWAGETLLSGDGDGRVAVWSLEDRIARKVVDGGEAPRIGLVSSEEVRHVAVRSHPRHPVRPADAPRDSGALPPGRDR